MVKKITKYLKFAVCCTLILSLIAPSYAALSASDGSAFVTKAEFASALADFNARLTTFEAGINSKIDSQVTSYLDRNGIWNGMKPSWLGKQVAGYISYNGKNAGTYIDDYTWDPDGSRIYNRQNGQTITNYGYYTFATIAPFAAKPEAYNMIGMPLSWTATKSGLCFCDLGLKGALPINNISMILASGNYGNRIVSPGLYAYSLEMGFLWGIASDWDYEGTLVADHENEKLVYGAYVDNSTWNNIVFLPSINEDEIKAFSYQIVIPMNLKVSETLNKKGTWKFSFPARSSYPEWNGAPETTLSIQQSDLVGAACNGGQYKTQFFVAKEDIIYFSPYFRCTQFDVEGNFMQQYQIWDWDVGNGLDMPNIGLSIY